jgi:hypothetical protein
MIDVPTLMVDKYFHLSICMRSLGPRPSFPVLFMRGTKSLFNWLVPMYRDNKLKEKEGEEGRITDK